MKYDITLNGKKYIVDVDNNKATIDIMQTMETQKDEELTELDLPDFDFSEKDENTSIVKAPLPGTIVSLLVKKGDCVSKGQTLMVFESMKMENEISSPIDGEVVDLFISIGSSVHKDEQLLALNKME